MDELNEEVLEANWVFIEEIDPAEEALSINQKKVDIANENQLLGESSGENQSETKSCSESHLHNMEEDFIKFSDKQNVDSDGESDGISIISNWSCNEDTPECENLDDNFYLNDVKEDSVVGSYEKPLIEEVKDNRTSSQVNYEPEVYEVQEDVKNTIVPTQSISPELNQADLLKSEQDFKPRLNKVSEGTDYNADEHSLRKYVISKISQFLIKKISVSTFLISTVIIASSSVFLGRYFSATKTVQDDLPTYQENVFLYDVPSNDFDVSSPPNLYKERQKSDHIYMEIHAHKCLNNVQKHGKCKTDEKNMKKKVESTEKHFINKRISFDADDGATGQDRTSQTKETQESLKSKKYTRYVKHENNSKPNEIYSKEKIYERDKKLGEKSHKQEKRKQKMVKNNQHYCKNYVEHKNHKTDDVYRDFQKTKNYKKFIGSDSGAEKYKVDLHFRNNMKTNKKENKYKEKKNEKNLKYSKENKKKTYKFSDSEKHLGNKIEQNADKHRHKYNKNYEHNFVLVNKNNKTVDGTWHGKLFKGRDTLRTDGNSGEWYFDRSLYRKRKRDKAGWYFEWMMDREVLRNRNVYLNQ